MGKLAGKIAGHCRRWSGIFGDSAGHFRGMGHLIRGESTPRVSSLTATRRSTGVAIWSRYRYRVEDYWTLIQTLRQGNKYTHGALLERAAWTGDPEGPKRFQYTAVCAVPEGWVLLGRKAKHRGWPPLADLRSSPSLRLLPFIVRWRPEFSDQKLGRKRAGMEGAAGEPWTLEGGRLSLQINRDFVRLKLKIVDEMTRRMHAFTTTPQGVWAAWRKEAEVIKGVNTVTRELIALKRWAFVESDTYRAYDTEVRRLVRRWLSSVRGRSSAQAQEITRRYLIPWRYNPQGHPSKLWLAHQAALKAAEVSKPR